LLPGEDEKYTNITADAKNSAKIISTKTKTVPSPSPYHSTLVVSFSPVVVHKIHGEEQTH
jgi:hypothetical protein